MTRTVDTRFFIRHFTADTDILKERTRRKMRDLQRESAIVPTIVIHELYKQQLQSLGRETAEVRTNIILHAGFNIVNLDVPIAKKAGELRCLYSDLPTADAIIVGTAIAAKSFKVVSDDPHLQAIREIKTEWL